MAARKPKAKRSPIDAGAVGGAGATALRTARFLAKTAPDGRYFEAIKTLTEVSRAAAAEFEAASLAALEAERQAHIDRGLKLTGELSEAFRSKQATPLPDFMRQR